jgi:lipopolysaccharide transport system ATP-binding protein
VINQYTELLFGREKSEIAPVAKLIRPAAQPNGALPDFPDDPFFREHSLSDLFSARNTYNGYEHRWGNGDANILDYYLEGENGEPYPSTVEMDSVVTLYIKILAHRDVDLPILGLTIKTKEGLLVYGSNSLLASGAGQHRPLVAGQLEIIRFRWKVRYNGGDYLLSVGLASGETFDSATALDRRYDSILLPVMPSKKFIGLADMELTLERFSAPM